MSNSDSDIPIKLVTSHRRARYLYQIFDTYEAGLALVGTEVKSLRSGHCDLTGSFAVIEGDEVYLKDAEIGQYTHGNRQNHEAKRRRKLLLHRKEIAKLKSKSREKGFTLVPLRVYFKKGRAKVEIGVARGKKQQDRRQDKAKQEAKRDIDRELARRRKYQE